MKVQVAITKSKNTEERITRLMEHLGGMSRFIDKGDVVFLKPNLVYPQKPPMTTDPEVVGILTRMCIDAGAKRVIVGEAGAPIPKGAGGFTIRDEFEVTGMKKAVEENGGEIACLDEEEIIEVPVPNGIIYKKVKLYRSVYECDKKISIPVMKTHYDTDVTLGIKNWHGAIADEDKFWKFHRDELEQKLVDIAALMNPCLTVIDGNICMEGRGPMGGSPIEVNIAVGGADWVAVDAVGAMCMGYDPYEIGQLRIASQMKLGTRLPEEIDIIGERVEDVKVDFVRPDILLTGVFENVTVIEGAVCRTERARARWALEVMKETGKLDGKHWIMIIGADPFLPDPAEYPDSHFIIFGSRACFGARSLRRLPKDRITFVEGEPPTPVGTLIDTFDNPRIPKCMHGHGH